MSFTEKDRKIRSKDGKMFPIDATMGEPHPPFVQAIAAALRREYGGSTSSVKDVVRLTNANERAVKNWFDAKNGPNGENLIALMQHSDEILSTVLVLASRSELLVTLKVAAARSKLQEILGFLDQLGLMEAP